MLKQLTTTIALLVCTLSLSQSLTSNQIKQLISSYKSDVRGPYQRIKWFCDDGTEREPKDPCPDKIGGVQHAKYKESLIQLREQNHLFFGDILAAEDQDQFLDKANFYNHLKQYQINKYLYSVDNGWVLRKAQYYRGAFQSEDEEAWGKSFFLDILKDDNFVTSQYYLIRQALKDIPHNGDNNIAQLMRSQSKILSEDLQDFMSLRIKIHGQPDANDIELVKAYFNKNQSKLSLKQKQQFEELIQTMQTFYAPLDFDALINDIKQIDTKNSTYLSIVAFLNQDKNETNVAHLVQDLSNLLYTIRTNILDFKSSEDRLLLLDLTNQLEKTLLIESQNYTTTTLHDNILKINTLACAATGTGLIENWEYNAIENRLNTPLLEDQLTLNTLNEYLIASRSLVEWSSAMPKAIYNTIIESYTDFEPLAYGFIDDKVRSSIALNLGETVSNLGVFIAKESKIKNDIENLSNSSSVRGLNPGYAKGTLVVVEGNPDKVEVNTNNIYIFERPPSDLKPVAGIFTVSEGNLVSHVQLLARNLGIPNAALSYDNLKELKQLDGQTVFYAVSNKGNVILKKENQMTSQESSLFTAQQQNKNVIEVPTNQIRLDIDNVVNMRDVNATDSGKLCGPKAANLGELKAQFPDHVVEGLIIPFGIFKAHMLQEMNTTTGQTYWEYLNSIFAKAKTMREDNIDETTIENMQLDAFKTLREAIVNMPLKPEFINDIKRQFKVTFKSNLGQVPVFLRSDTNMEDLKEFTGAGLNLTLFNILDEDEILKGIKRVWASPYTERSFKWRQKYLSNPENVYPSILIIPSVDVDYSGVMITKGINQGTDKDLTVAFSLGAGGAVDGQSAETRLITNQTDYLLAPARQLQFIRLPKTGGVKTYATSFNAPILNQKNIDQINKLANSIRKHMGTDQAYDVEFGFKDNNLWLFQIRPFVENKTAKSSEYLQSISPKIDLNQTISLQTTL